MRRELHRQLQNLHDLGYPALAGISPQDLDALVEPLAERLPEQAPRDGRIPFVLVVTSSLVPTVDAVGRWSVRGKVGWTDMAEELADYRPVAGLDLPPDPAYLLLDVDTGQHTLDVAPDDALPRIRAAGRTPLTIDEGVALVTHFPDVFSTRNPFQALGTQNAFQALGSRAANRRVPSFWVSKGAPRLGWCWAGNPHSWLGAASARGRRGAA